MCLFSEQLCNCNSTQVPERLPMGLEWYQTSAHSLTYIHCPKRVVVSEISSKDMVPCVGSLASCIVHNTRWEDELKMRPALQRSDLNIGVLT